MCLFAVHVCVIGTGDISGGSVCVCDGNSSEGDEDKDDEYRDR